MKIKKPIPQKPLKGLLNKCIVLGISTAGGAGFSPIAPGTAGSLVGIPLGLWLLQIPTWLALLVCVILFLILTPLAGRAAEHWGEGDCQRVVSDEVLGQAISFLSLRHAPILENVEIFQGIQCQIPPLSLIVACFLLFRAFDIVKPYPAKTFDRLEGGFGIMADDVVAGLYAALFVLGLSKILHSSKL